MSLNLTKEGFPSFIRIFIAVCLVWSLGKPSKKNSSSDSSDGFGSRSGKTGQKDFNIINFDKIRNLEPTKRLRVVQQTIGEQMEVVNKENRKQEGLKKLAQVRPIFKSRDVIIVDSEFARWPDDKGSPTTADWFINGYQASK